MDSNQSSAGRIVTPAENPSNREDFLSDTKKPIRSISDGEHRIIFVADLEEFVGVIQLMVSCSHNTMRNCKYNYLKCWIVLQRVLGHPHPYGSTI